MKRNKLLLISGIIGTAYLIYVFSYFVGINADGDVGSAVATALVAPHMVMVLIAVIFNWLGYILKVRWGALVAGNLYAVAIFFMPAYFMFVLIELILCFIAFARMKKPINE